MHLVPPGIVAAARAGRFGMDVDEKTLAVGKARVPLGKIVNVEALLARLDADRLEGGFVAVPPGLFRADQPHQQRRDWAEFVNAAMGELMAAHSTRLRGLAFLPAEDPALAAQLATELDGSWAGVTFGTQLNGGRFHEPKYEVLWSALEEHGLPVLLHPDHPADPRLEEFYLTNLLGYPHETTVAAAHIVLGGVLERHPNLRILLSHGGAAVATLAGRWQRGATMKRPGVPQLRLGPLEYVKRFYFDTVVHSRPYIDFLIDTVGVDRLLLGSDWPFPMGTDAAEDDVGHLSDEARGAIRVGNVERVFGVPIAG